MSRVLNGVAVGLWAALLATAAPATASEYDLLLLDGLEDCALGYPDIDDDDFGSAFGVGHRCDPLPSTFVRVGGDCDDGNPAANPNATELQPNDQYADENCDGADGNANLAIFASDTGAAAPCGTRATPCTLAVAIAQAAIQGRQQLYLSTGSHTGPVQLTGAGNTLRIFGGYSDQFRLRSPPGAGGNTRIIGPAVPGVGAYAVQATSGAVIELSDLNLASANVAAQTMAGNGLSSFGARVFGGATLTTHKVAITAGNGAAGANGGAGTSAAPIAAQSFMNGIVGGNGDEFFAVCDNSSRGLGGGRGTNSCAQSPSTRDMDGGSGGNGGTMDTSCSGLGGTCTGSGCDARPGDTGANADHRNGPLGQGGPGGTGEDFCGPTTAGNNGEIADGAAGTRGTGFALDGNLVITTSSGNAGGTGQNGGGGGGGGGSGGCDDGTDAYGPGGGGGGAGGCAAVAPGGGGRGGGASIGIAVFNATVNLDQTDVFVGNGGRGGDGGTGGSGQAGGSGNTGGANPGTAVPGVGGNGARGGHSGGGGGGTGGGAVGLLTFNATLQGSAPIVTFNGTSGQGGSGGTGATPGTTGQSGFNGPQAAQRNCASAASC